MRGHLRSTRAPPRQRSTVALVACGGRHDGGGDRHRPPGEPPSTPPLQRRWVAGTWRPGLWHLRRPSSQHAGTPSRVAGEGLGGGKGTVRKGWGRFNWSRHLYRALNVVEMPAVGAKRKDTSGGLHDVQYPIRHGRRTTSTQLCLASWSGAHGRCKLCLRPPIGGFDDLPS